MTAVPLPGTRIPISMKGPFARRMRNVTLAVIAAVMANVITRAFAPERRIVPGDSLATRASPACHLPRGATADLVAWEARLPWVGPGALRGTPRLAGAAARLEAARWGEIRQRRVELPRPEAWRMPRAARRLSVATARAL